MPEKEKELHIPEIKTSTTDIPQIHAVAADTKVSKPRKMSIRNRKIIKIVLIVLGVFVALGAILAIIIGIPAVNAYGKAKILQQDMALAKEAFKSQDLQKIKDVSAKTQVDIKNFQVAYSKMAALKLFPILSNYYKDGEAGLNAANYGLQTADLVEKTIEPYADIIGLANGPNKGSSENANDRIEFFISTINSILPKLDEISQKANLAKAELDKIDAGRYPTNIKGTNVQEKIRQAQTLMAEATQFISEGKPLLQQAPYLLGKDSARTYMVIFQNDKELRPTGGFMTGYSIMKVRNGKFEPVISSDMYNLDANYNPTIVAADPLIKYLKGPYTASNKLRLRDMNWSPDYKVDMDQFIKEAKTVGVTNLDGIISVDTHVLVKLLNVIGQIGVPGFGNFSTANDARCNCPNVIYELESFADVEGPVVWSENEPGKIVFAPPNYDNRKKILGPLMNSVMANALGQPKSKLPLLFQAGWESLTEKHILFYGVNADAQKAAEAFNIAGRVQDYDGDYLEINDANLGGRKSNLYVTQEVNQIVTTTSDGSIEKTLEITYKNPQSQDGWLNSVLPSWVRIYVPKGSTLVSAEGFEAKQEPYEDLGKTVFAGLYRLRPQGVVKLTLKYKLPFKSDGKYNLLIQKQPGTDAPNYTVQVKRQRQEFQLKIDQELHFNL